MKKLLSLLLLTYSIAGAQIYNWEQVFRGDITDMDVASNGYIFAVGFEYMTGSHNVLLSTDNGKNWTGLNLMDVSNLTIDQNDILYAGKYNEGIFISSDYGSTWILSYQYSTSSIWSITISPEGYIYAGTSDGTFLRSTDSGNSWTWISIVAPYHPINSISTLSTGQIFAAVDGEYIYTSTDHGNTWTQKIDPNLEAQIGSIISDNNDFLYAEHGFHISFSTDIGETWHLTDKILLYTGYFEPILAVDSLNNLYYAGSEIYKSSNNGIDWSLLGPLYRVSCIVKISDYILAGTPYGIYRYDQNYTPDVGKNYLPLDIGNKWQYITYHRSLQYYSLDTISIERDTMINQTKYFLFQDNWIRYSEADKKIYIFWNDTVRVFFDFLLPSGSYFQQFSRKDHHYRDVILFSDSATSFGQKRKYGNYVFWDPNPMTQEDEEEYYYEGLGLKSHNLLIDWHGGDDFKYTWLIMAIIKDSIGNPLLYSYHYKPEITLTPITSIKTSSFILKFDVDHVYSDYSQYTHEFFNFIDSVVLKSFYMNEEGITLNNQDEIAVNTPDTSEYTIEMSLDTMLLKQGYSFYYKIFAKDKGIIPEISYSPDTGYYQCKWDTVTGIRDEEEIPLEFALFQNYPNPFNPVTAIQYSISKESFVRLKVFDMLGREVKVLVNEKKEPGNYTVEFNAGNLSSGIYIYKIETKDFIRSRKMILVK